MASVSSSCCVFLEKPIDYVWKKVGNFADLTFLLGPEIKMECKGNGIGMERFITLPNGLLLSEKLISLDNKTHTQVYCVVKKGDQDCSYMGTIHADIYDSKTRVRWHCSEFVPLEKAEEHQKHLNGIMKNVESGFKSVE